MTTAEKWDALNPTITNVRAMESEAVAKAYPHGTKSLDPSISYKFKDGSVITVHNRWEVAFERFTSLHSHIGLTDDDFINL